MENNSQLDMTIDGSLYQHLDEITYRDMPNQSDNHVIQIPMNMVDMRSSTGIINASKKIFRLPQQQLQQEQTLIRKNSNNNIMLIQEEEEEKDEYFPQQKQQQQFQSQAQTQQDLQQSMGSSKKNNKNISKTKPSLPKSKDDIVIELDGEDLIVKKIKRTDGKLAYKYYNWNSELKEQQLDEIIDLYKQYQGQSETLQKDYNFREFQTNKSYLDKYQTQFLFDFFKLSKEVEGNQPQQQQQEQEIDEDATLVEDDGLYDQIQQQDQDNQNKIKPWRSTNEDFMTTYVKNRRIFVTNLIHKGGQGSIYAGLNRKNNKLLVFKEFEREPEYIIEKNIYQKFQSLPGQIQSYLDVEGLDFDNEFYLLIVAKAECSLLDYMRMHQENFIKQREIIPDKKKKGRVQVTDLIMKKDKYDVFQYQSKNEIDEKWRFHLSDKEFTELLLFQAESMLLFQKQGIYYQDNKPDNILMKKQIIDGKTVYQMKYADFGGVFDENVAEAQFYPNCYTESYYDSELKYEKTGITYTTVNRVHNEIYTVGRTMQKSLFPDIVKSEFVSSVLSKGNVKQFGEQIALQYEQELADIFMKLVDSDYSKRYQSFEEFQQEVKTYYINNFSQSIEEVEQWKKKELLAPQFNFLDQGNQIKNFNLARTEEFYKKYFGDMVNINMDFQTVERIFNDFFESSLFRESIVFQEIAANMLKEKQKKPQFKEQVTGDMIQKLQLKIGSTYQKIGETEMAKKILQDMLKQFEENSLQAALTKSYLGDVLRELGEQEEAKKILMEAESVQKDQPQDLQLSYLNLGRLYMDMKEYKLAKENFSKVIGLKNDDKKSLEYAQVLVYLGGSNISLGEYEKAKQEYEQALEIQEEIKGKNCLQAGFTLKELGNAYNKLRQYEKSQELYQKSIHIQNTYQGENHIDTVPTLLLLGDLLKSQDKIQEAKKYYEQCLEIVKGSYGDYHVQTMVPMGRLADIMVIEGEKEDAQEIYQLILDIQKEHYGDKHIKLVETYQKLCKVFDDSSYKSGKFMKEGEKIMKKHYGENHPEYIEVLIFQADNTPSLQRKSNKSWYLKALGICKSFYGEEHIEYGELLVRVGQNFDNNREYDKGPKFVKQGLEILKKFYGNDDHQQLFWVYQALGNIMLWGNKFNEAEEIFNGLLKKFYKKYGKDHQKTAFGLYKIGQILQNQEQFKEAEKYLKVGLKIQRKIYGKYHESNERNFKMICQCYKKGRSTEEEVKVNEKLMKYQQKVYGEVCKEIIPVVKTLEELYRDCDRDKFWEIRDLEKKVDKLKEDDKGTKKSAIKESGQKKQQDARDKAKQGKWSSAALSKYFGISSMKSENEPMEKIQEGRIELGYYYKKDGDLKKSRKELRKAFRYFEKVYGKQHRKCKVIKQFIKGLGIDDGKNFCEKQEDSSDDEDYWLYKRYQREEDEKKQVKEKPQNSQDQEDKKQFEEEEDSEGEGENDYGIWDQL